MLLKLLRFSSTDKRTLGAFYINDVFACFTLEDPPQVEKIAGETRIPCGTYVVDFQYVETNLTLKYRSKFPQFFKHHLEIKNVPGFTTIYIHAGNVVEHTEGCLLVGDTAMTSHPDGDRINSSSVAFERIYKTITAAMEGGESCSIEIIDYA